MSGSQRYNSPLFAKETDLCAAFAAALPEEWVAYNECQGWDILLVRKLDGCQIGVQAKLKLNAEVLCQAAEHDVHFMDYPCPDYRAVLVPASGTGGLSALAPHCGITIIAMRSKPPDRYNPGFDPSLPTLDKRLYYLTEHWHEMLPTKRHPLPEYVPDVVAGASGPIQLTEWKIKALKLCVLLDQTGYLTRADFARLKVDIRRWTNNWLEPHPEGLGFRARGDLARSFRRQHPKVWEQILAEPAKWQRPADLLSAAG